MPRPNDVGVGAIVLLFDKQDRVLLGKRKGSHRAGVWAAPGGWMDRGDVSSLDTVQRELREETGIEMPPWTTEVFWTVEDHPEAGFQTVSLYHVGFVPDGTHAELREPEKCEEWRWMSVSEWGVPGFPLFPKLRTALFRAMSRWETGRLALADLTKTEEDAC